MGVDVRHHRSYLLRRPSAAWANYADAVLRISFVRFSTRFSRSSAASRSRSLVVRARALAGAALSLAHPFPQRLGRDAELRRHGLQRVMPSPAAVASAVT